MAVIRKNKVISSFLTRICNAVFDPEKENEFPWLKFAWIGLLILAGVILWGFFFNWGNVDINYMDWGEVWAARLQAWRVALQQNTLPFHLSDVAAMRSSFDRYFSIADMVSSPQVILLRWLEVGAYALVNTWILYGVAAFFLLKIRKRYRLSLFAFTVMFLLFQFNGYIVAHQSVGHLCWGGYFLFPGFILFLLELLEGDRSWKWVAKMAVLLCLMFMQGSFHHLVWCFIVMGILAVIFWKSFFTLVKAVFFTILLSMARILPVFIGPHTPLKTLDFIGGYNRLGDIFQSLLSDTPITLGMPGNVYENPLGYWEFDVYIGWAGLAFVIVFGIIYYGYWHAKRKTFPTLIIPAAVLVILSIQDNYLKVLFQNSFLASSERVTSRMIGLALAIVIILAAIYYQRFLEKTPHSLLFQVPQVALLLVLANNLVTHTIQWDVNNGATYLGAAERDLSRIQISNHADPEYFTLLIIGTVISLLTVVFLVWICRKQSAEAAQHRNDVG